MDNHYHLLFDIRRKFRNAQFTNPEGSDFRNSEMNGVNFAPAVERKFPSSQFANPKENESRNSEISGTNFAPKHQLVEFIRKIHKDSSRVLNKLDKITGRKIWYQYWDHCIRDEEDFYKHFNYIYNNPIKHKKVKNIDKLNFYKYSSFNTWIKKKGREWIVSCFEDYPILDYSEDI